MTLQQSILLSATIVLAIPAPASAQCSRGRTYAVPRYQRSVHVVPYTDYAPNVYVSARRPTSFIEDLPNVTFGSCSHVSDLAGRLELLMNELCLDLHYNYSHNPKFDVTYAEAYALYELAQTIHATSHTLSEVALRQQLAGADALFHHVECEVAGWTRIAHRQIGTLGLQTKLELAEDTLHHLMQDVGVSVAPQLEVPPVPASAPHATGLVVPPAPAIVP